MDLALVAQDLQADLSKEIGVTFHNKEDSDIMKAVGTGLDLGRVFSGGLPSSKDFMANFATTLAKEVYIPKVIRDNPVSLMVVSTHEGEHGLQWGDTNVEFAWFYGTDQAARAQFEADAYAAGLSVKWWLTGRVPKEDIPWVLDSMVKSYHLRDSDRVYAETALKSHFASLNSGIVMTRSARIAIKFLEAKYPKLKGAVIA